MDPGTVLLPHLVIVILLLGVALVGRRPPWLPALPLLDAALLAVYVFGEDTYQGHISRWDSYRTPGGALGPMFILSLVSSPVARPCSPSRRCADATRCFGRLRSPAEQWASSSSSQPSSASAPTDLW